VEPVVDPYLPVLDLSLSVAVSVLVVFLSWRPIQLWQRAEVCHQMHHCRHTRYLCLSHVVSAAGCSFAPVLVGNYFGGRVGVVVIVFDGDNLEVRLLTVHSPCSVFVT
jgi:hypothetical protein